VRIITGKYRGRRLEPPAVATLRPTTEEAREALFSLLSARLHWAGLRVLDLFAGSGALGLEALSRGATAVVAVERSPVLVGFLRQIQRKWPVDGWTVVQADAAQWIETAADRFDLVLIDPPYERPSKDLLPQRIAERGLLSPGATVVLEHPATETYVELPGYVESRNYGLVAFSFFQYADA